MSKVTRRGQSRGESVKEVIGPVHDGSDGWHVRTTSGRVMVIRSSRSSNTVMDRAMTKYDGALRRLANR